MDESTVIAVLKLQLQDIDEFLNFRKGKQKSDEVIDIEYAFQLQQDDIRASITALEDRRICQSISRAVQDDGPILAIALAEENQARRDRLEACALGSEDDAGVVSGVDELRGYPPEDVLARLSALNIYNEDECCSLLGTDETNPGEGQAPQEMYECVACLDARPGSKVYIAPCSDAYCNRCVVRLFEDAMLDESLFPPRCCRQEMPLSGVRKILGATMIQRVELKAIEVGTLDRTYCAEPSCSKFILPYHIRDDRAECPSCLQQTCVCCKRAYHSGGCEAALDNEVLQIAEEAGWQRCYQCQSMVELRTGCNHITCRCRAELCYLCGARWKTCDCAQWDEHQLLERAAIAVDRNPPRGLLPVGHGFGREVAVDLFERLPMIAQRIREEQVRQVAEELRKRHECEHNGRWIKRGGSHRCEECSHTLPLFILECQR